MNETTKDEPKTIKFKTTDLFKNEEVVFTLPDLTDIGHVPSSINFNQTGNILVKVLVGGNNVITRGQPFFSVTDELDLIECMREISTGRSVVVKVINKYHKSQKLNMTVTYAEHQGGVIYENVVDDSDLSDLLSNIADLGTLSQLVITSSVRLKSAKMVPIITDSFGAIGGANIPINDRNPTSSLLVMDMVGSKLQKYIRWMQLQVEPVKQLEDDEVIVLNVLAFGYSK